MGDVTPPSLSDGNKLIYDYILLQYLCLDKTDPRSAFKDIKVMENGEMVLSLGYPSGEESVDIRVLKQLIDDVPLMRPCCASKQGLAINPRQSLMIQGYHAFMSFHAQSQTCLEGMRAIGHGMSQVIQFIQPYMSYQRTTDGKDLKAELQALIDKHTIRPPIEASKLAVSANPNQNLIGSKQLANFGSNFTFQGENGPQVVNNANDAPADNAHKTQQQVPENIEDNLSPDVGNPERLTDQRLLDGALQLQPIGQDLFQSNQHVSKNQPSQDGEYLQMIEASNKSKTAAQNDPNFQNPDLSDPVETQTTDSKDMIDQGIPYGRLVKSLQEEITNGKLNELEEQVLPTFLLKISELKAARKINDLFQLNLGLPEPNGDNDSRTLSLGRDRFAVLSQDPSGKVCVQAHKGTTTYGLMWPQAFSPGTKLLHSREGNFLILLAPRDKTSQEFKLTAFSYANMTDVEGHDWLNHIKIEGNSDLFFRPGVQLGQPGEGLTLLSTKDVVYSLYEMQNQLCLKEKRRLPIPNQEQEKVLLHLSNSALVLLVPGIEGEQLSAITDTEKPDLVVTVITYKTATDFCSVPCLVTEGNRVLLAIEKDKKSQIFNASTSKMTAEASYFEEGADIVSANGCFYWTNFS